MAFQKIETKSACNCTKPQIYYKLDKSIEKSHLEFFTSHGYNEQKSYTRCGILYMDNEEAIIICQFGGNKLQIKPKVDNFDYEKIENILRLM